MANTNAFYAAVLKGSYAAQDIINVLWYRLGFDLIPGDFNLAGAEDLAFQVKQEVWTGGLKSILPEGYALNSIDVYPRDEDFNLIYQSPHTLQVGENGTATGNAMGPGPCAIVKCNLAPTTVLQGFFPPRRGYFAIGPLLENDVDGFGRIVSDKLDDWQTACSTLAATLENASPPATFEPIKMKLTRALGGLLTLQGWADITSVSVRSATSFRRSRVVEA